jgi:hypothetical protein
VTDRETRLRERIDVLTDERDKYREQRDRLHSRLSWMRQSRNTWRARAGFEPANGTARRRVAA